MRQKIVLILTDDNIWVEKFGELVSEGWRIISTEETVNRLRRQGIPCGIISWAEYSTEFIRENDLIVIVNCKFKNNDQSFQDIKIKELTLLSMAAKNGINTIPLVDPRDYDEVIELVKTNSFSLETRERMVYKAFHYIHKYLKNLDQWIKFKLRCGKSFLTT